jgi:mannose-6-phosphate isomerase
MTTTVHHPGASPPYPLVFRPLLFEKVWGGDRLRRFGKPVAAGHRVGESWEVADLAQTSVSGAGGGAVRSVVSNGTLTGRTLSEVRRVWGDGAVFGRAVPAADFPLLVKFLDARENLSVQVHPSPQYLAKYPLGQAHLKTECWYVLDAEPGGVIFKGVRPGVTREELARGTRDGSIVGMMEAVPAVAGDCHNLPSGTVHALGAGVLVAEVQTPSDTTFRLYDWGRTGRELHVAQALECALLEPAPPSERRSGDTPLGRLVSTEFFALWDLILPGGGWVRLPEPPGCAIIMLLTGKAELALEGAAAPPQKISAGMTALVPAAVCRAACVRAVAPLTALVAMVP